MPKRRQKRTARSNSSTDAKPALPVTVKFEAYEQVFIGPLFSTVLGIPIYLCKRYWEKFPEVGVYETVGVALCLSLIVFFLLYLPHLLYRAFTNKGFVPIAIFLFFLTFVGLSALTWKIFVPLNSTNATNSTDSEVAKETNFLTEATRFEVSKLVSSHYDQLGEQVQSSRIHNTESVHPSPLLDQNADDMQPSSTLEEQFQSLPKLLEKPNDKEEILEPLSASSKSNEHIEFNGDCEEYSRHLLSVAVLSSPKRYHIKGQVNIFEQTIHLTGKPSFLVFSGDPSEYEADALDVMNRRHNAGALSSVSVKDAVEKALVKMCQNLRRDGFGM